MQGALIVSTDTAVRKSLAAILRPGRVIRESDSIRETLVQAASEKFDFIFIDGDFADGSSEDLASDLNALGYGVEIIPVLLSLDRVYQQPFREYGVRCCIAKPFKVQQIEEAIEQIEEIVRLSDKTIDHAREAINGGGLDAGSESLTPIPPTEGEIDVREVSQRFRRLLARLRSREELIRAFADSIQEQFDVDNVIVLMPTEDRPAYSISYGDLPERIKNQFSLHLNEPLLKSLIRLGEPVWVHDRDRLGRQNAVTAIRCGERLNIQILCPVLSRGQLRAVVGLSRFHRYHNNPAVVSLLRLFLTFFAESLENSDLYARLAGRGRIHRAFFQGIDFGILIVSSTGVIADVNPAAFEYLKLNQEELLGQPVEKAGSLLAHHARTVLEHGLATEPEIIDDKGNRFVLSASLMPETGLEKGGAIIYLRRFKEEAREGDSSKSTKDNRVFTLDAEELWKRMVKSIAHNFKNAFVPIQTCSELLPQRYEDEEFRKFFMNTVGNNIGRIDEWIKQLLELAANDNLDDWHSLSLREVIEAGLSVVQERYSELTVTVETDYISNDKIKGDQPSLWKMFSAIIENAFEASRDLKEPVIRIGTEINENDIIAYVQDNAGKIESEVREVIFLPFTTTKESDGLGLGLTYALKVAEQHGGSVRVDSGNSAGTRIEVILPKSKVFEKDGAKDE